MFILSKFEVDFMYFESFLKAINKKKPYSLIAADRGESSFLKAYSLLNFWMILLCCPSLSAKMYIPGSK